MIADNHSGAADLLVIFGITGDLAHKMTFRALYRLERLHLLDCPIIGIAADEMTVAQLVKQARAAITDAGGARPLYYPEMPPTLFGPIVGHLGKAGLAEHARIAVEKPFGHDLDSARRLNAQLHQVLTESQILRVDHFLGKEPVIELTICASPTWRSPRSGTVTACRACRPRWPKIPVSSTAASSRAGRDGAARRRQRRRVARQEG